MVIPRKPDRKTEVIENFIKKGPAQAAAAGDDEKKGRKVISLSLIKKDAEWIDQILEQINSHTQRKITRSEVISAAITSLREKSLDNIIELIKNR